LYVEERLSLEAIGKQYGVARGTVAKWMRLSNIPRRSTGEARTGMKMTLTEESKERRRQQAMTARSKITAESRKKQAAKMKGRPAPNKGKKMSDEQRALLKEQRADPEYRRRSSERQLGEKSVHWRGGHESRSPRGFEWKARRLECYARDNWSCRDCGVKCSSGNGARASSTRIQAHHIVRRRDGGSDDLTNLVTLCLGCHTRREQRSKGALFA
jgi:5-methylcytosine-specific restriction endonuclease McrA